MKAVTMLPNGDFNKMEPFMEGEAFASPIDMEVGKDGRIYGLEYGSGWFSKNADAGIARIDFITGNVPPKVGTMAVEKLNGETPFIVAATIEASDYEGDELSYTWQVDGTTQQTSKPQLTYTLNKTGEFPVHVSVSDGNGKTDGTPVTVYAGNDNPVVEIVLTGTSDAYSPGEPIGYEVKVDDNGRAIDLASLVVAVDYINGKDLAGASMGHQRVSDRVMGRNLMLASDCQSCHNVNETSVGPSFMQIATRYKHDWEAARGLAVKIDRKRTRQSSSH